MNNVIPISFHRGDVVHAAAEFFRTTKKGEFILDRKHFSSIDAQKAAGGIWRTALTTNGPCGASGAGVQKVLSDGFWQTDFVRRFSTRQKPYDKNRNRLPKPVWKNLCS